jgi:hypothetical protein
MIIEIPYLMRPVKISVSNFISRVEKRNTFKGRSASIKMGQNKKQDYAYLLRKVINPQWIIGGN